MFFKSSDSISLSNCQSILGPLCLGIRNGVMFSWPALTKTPALVFKKARHPFKEEIRSMMYIFGDVENPLHDSAKLISKFLKYQINLFLSKASQGFFENQTVITHKNLLPLLKQKKEKLHHLLHYLAVKDELEAYKKKEFDITDIPKGKRAQICSGYLNEVYDTQEFDATPNTAKAPIVMKRMKMRYLRTQNMSNNKYYEYSKKLQVSFLHRDKEKFVMWLLEDSPNLKFSDLALEILNFLAREAVAEIVELAVSVQNSKPVNSYQLGEEKNQRKEPGTSLEFSNPNSLNNSLSNESSSEMEFLDYNSDNKKRKVSDLLPEPSTQVPIYPRTIREVLNRLTYFNYTTEDRGNLEDFLF